MSGLFYSIFAMYPRRNARGLITSTNLKGYVGCPIRHSQVSISGWPKEFFAFHP
ncbi:hypothetical protein HanIR_Chr15g0732561 [Helianthus annuus]|nr:hypothetical protein HanIR_Chr15g0732561 [Helianthus annuus]